MSDLTREDTLKGDEKIIAEAKRRYKQGMEWEGDARKGYNEDLKFANADTDNGWQWPDDIRGDREIDAKPCLTINKTRQHNLQIINEQRQNKPSIKVRPVGNAATYESAEVMEGIIRHIEYISNAEQIYDNATKFQVEAGIGYWRVVTDYMGDDSFDQEIFLKRLKNPLNVILDSDINELDGSDARWGIIFDDIPRDSFNERFPEFKDSVPQNALDNDEDWLTEDHVRVAEYFRAVPKKQKMVAFTDPRTGLQHVLKDKEAKEALKEFYKAVIDDPQTKQRSITDTKIEWYLIVGSEIVERKDWPGKYIPIVRVIGEETIIDGKLDRKGHTRALKDPQRMYNYAASTAVEVTALQPKIPFVAPVAAIENLGTYWETANRVNHAVLPYNHRDDKGNEIPPPRREPTPGSSPGNLELMQTSQQEMMMVSGQYEANFGQKSNEKSGVAINERQRQGDTATYHFIDNLGIAIRYTGKIVIDLIPKIYDTPRIIRLLGEDGVESHVIIDPNARDAYMQYQDKLGKEVKAIFNPNVGKYDVMADVGPGYATKRQEAFNAFQQIISQSPQMISLAGDLLFRNADFPGADTIAERLERMVPAQAKGDAPPPEMQQLHEQLQQASSVNSKLLEELSHERQKTQVRTEQKEIDEYKAITDRLKVLLPTILNPKDIAVMIHDLMVQEKQTQLQNVTEAANAELESGMPGQQQDGMPQSQQGIV